MYELWMDKAEPSVRLVTRSGSGLPADLGPRDWKRLGPFNPDPATADAVATRGYHFFHTEEPVPDPASLKDSNASGQ